MNMNFHINEEFAKLIPPLSSDELYNLEQSLLNEGCLHALVVWNNTIIDGHHRYAICSKHGISFKVVEKTGLETELDVKLWMINNQFSRRNLPTETRLALAYKFKEFEVERARERKLANLKQFSEQTKSTEISDIEAQPVGHREELEKDDRSRGALGEIAKRAGVSHTTAEQYDTIQRKGTDEQKAEVAEGRSSIKKMYNEIKKANKLEKEPNPYNSSQLSTNGVMSIQEHITGIYDALEGFNNYKDMVAIRYWLSNTSLSQNDNFRSTVLDVEKQKKVVTRNLTVLSEGVDDLEFLVNRCKHFVSVETQKDKKFLNEYNKYYG